MNQYEMKGGTKTIPNTPYEIQCTEAGCKVLDKMPTAVQLLAKKNRITMRIIDGEEKKRACLYPSFS
jgi:hypothetical protein